MKKTIIISIIMLTVGFTLGFIYSQSNTVEEYTKTSDKNLLSKTEEYTPSCKELKNKGIPSISKKGSNYFLVLTQKDYFYVLGINNKEKNTPSMTWWGSELKSAQKQACDL